jgi:hypothetical protein
MMDDKRLVSIVNTEFKNAMGADGQEISRERELAWDRYLSRPMGNEVEGESVVVTSDVADVVDGMMPSLLRIFTTADNVVSFDPTGPEDIPLAEQESDYVNYVFFKENDAFLILYNWMFDALVAKNGIVKAWWDNSETVTEETYRGLSEEDATQLLDDEELEPVEREEVTETISVPNPQTGQMEEVEVTTQNITFRRVTTEGCVSVANVPPQEYRISSDSSSVNPNHARMVGHERDVTRSHLIEMGFKEEWVNDLPESGRHETTEDNSYRNKSDEQNGESQDKSQELVRLREAYIRVDFDEDGRSELRQVYTAGGALGVWADGTKANEIVDRQPFHIICSSPLPHKHFGRSIAEKVIDVQETTTTLTRQVLNNLYHTNNPGHAVDERGLGENTMDDLLTTRIGKVARFSRNPNEVYAPMTIPFTAGASFPMLEYFDKVKRDRTGINADGEGLSPEALKNIQTSVLSQSVDLSKMKIEAVARIFAETGFKTLFLHIHELLMKYQDREKVVRLRNKWFNVDPREWRNRFDMTVNIGLGVGTRQQNLLDLEAIWQKQVQMVEGGGMNLLVTPQNIYQTATEIVKNANLKNPDTYFTNPGDQPAPPPSDEQQEMQKMQIQLEQEKTQLALERQQVNAQKLQIDQAEMQLRHQREIFKIEEDREQREDRLFLDNEKLRNQLAELQLQAKAQGIELELKTAETDAKVQNMQADTLQKRANTFKTLNEAKAVDIENDAAESGLLDMIQGEGVDD